MLDIAADANVANRLNAGLRAAGALNRVGLDPEAFAIDRKLRPTPFPGLASFGDDDADAALFYGRSREIALALEELRKMRAERDPRPFVILGASGAASRRCSRPASFRACAARRRPGCRCARSGPAPIRCSISPTLCADACRFRQGRGARPDPRALLRRLVEGRARRE